MAVTAATIVLPGLDGPNHPAKSAPTTKQPKPNDNTPSGAGFAIFICFTPLNNYIILKKLLIKNTKAQRDELVQTDKKDKKRKLG